MKYDSNMKFAKYELKLPDAKKYTNRTPDHRTLTILKLKVLVRASMLLYKYDVQHLLTLCPSNLSKPNIL